MSDFDIVNVRARNSFLANMRKRKALGLDNSDSESDTESTTIKQKAFNRHHKKAAAAAAPPSSAVLSSSQQQQAPSVQKQEEIEEEASISDVNPYLISDENALELIKAISSAKSSNPIQSSPTLQLPEEDELLVLDDMDTTDLDPELAAVVKHPTDSLERETEPQKITIKLQYQHNFTTISQKSEAILEKLMKPIKVVIMDNNQFHKIMDVFCKHKKLNKSEFVLVYNEEPIFLSGTPSGLGMSPIGTNSMQVYPKHCYEEVRQQRQLEKEARLRRIAEAKNKETDEDLDMSKFSPTNSVQPSTLDTTEEEKKIILKLRGSDKKEISFRIKPSSTLSSLVDPYRARANADPSLRIIFEFEGEALDMNMKIEDTELEDEDIVEVKILP